MSMPRNITGYRQVLDHLGKPAQVPVPHTCACGEPACYGLMGFWYCSPCWQVRFG